MSTQFVTLHGEIPPVVCQDTVNHCSVYMSVQFALRLVISNSSSAHLFWLRRSVVQKIYDWQINVQRLVQPSLWTWLSTKQAAVFSQGSLDYDGVPSNWVWLQRDHPCWRHSRNDNMTHIVSFFTWHWLIIMHFHTRFSYERLCCSEDIIRVNSQWHFEPLLWSWPWP